ncbi:phosphopantothenoylcysteine decarboxylase isoform X2 [Kryptolebias marmoratus]|uniref:phosphopantothenoylcysteine decarboxylase isoform X2 n=1 Tax=Kryptolebias marmoratus TaxID=37003 RepID=UPI000D5311A2|nr:phosphopantothenoylcysteine decarboxylase isoform X2 [Kryptolebias marmoratus]
MQPENPVSSLKTDLLKSSGTFRVLVGVTGSVAALKLPVLVSELLQLPGVDVRVVTTDHAKHFYNPAEVSVKIYSDMDEWELWTQRSDPVLHIELRRWADLLIVAPLDANTLGKIASGICDNLLTCVVRAWDVSRPLLFCPAMNTAMWQHPITAQQVKAPWRRYQLSSALSNNICRHQRKHEDRLAVHGPADTKDQDKLNMMVSFLSRYTQQTMMYSYLL